jgi:hypothetical protein
VSARVSLDLISAGKPDTDVIVAVHLSNRGVAPKEVHGFFGFFGV